MKLHPIQHDRRTVLWCGPAAIAALTGWPTSRVHQELEFYLGRTRIKGMSTSELRRFLVWHGFRASEWESARARPTLAGWLRCRSKEARRHAVIVNVTRHFVVVSGNKFIDNHTREPVWLRDAPGRRRRVLRYMFVAQ